MILHSNGILPTKRARLSQARPIPLLKANCSNLIELINTIILFVAITHKL